MYIKINKTYKRTSNQVLLVANHAVDIQKLACSWKRSIRPMKSFWVSKYVSVYVKPLFGVG